MVVKYRSLHMCSDLFPVSIHLGTFEGRKNKNIIFLNQRLVVPICKIYYVSFILECIKIIFKLQSVCYCVILWRLNAQKDEGVKDMFTFTFNLFSEVNHSFVGLNRVSIGKKVIQ